MKEALIHHEIRPILEADKTLVERGLGSAVRWAWAVVLVLGVAGGAFYYRLPIEQPVELQQRVEVLRAENAKLEATRGEQARRVDWLKNEPEYLAIEARDHLNLKKPGETVVRLVK